MNDHDPERERGAVCRRTAHPDFAALLFCECPNPLNESCAADKLGYVRIVAVEYDFAAEAAKIA